MQEIKPVGTEQEIKLFTEVLRHYELAREDLEQRIKYFDKVDELFRSHIDESGWPYNATIFDPRVFTAIFEKSSRLFAKKPKGRMVPREGGDSLGARINNEILNFQWDDNERVDSQPMLAKWAQMDMNARKYGASFALAKWKYDKRVKRDKADETKGKAHCFYDGPDFRPLINRDCLPNPAYPYIKNWFQHRDYVTVQELESVNDAARGKPVYKNLDILRDKLKKETRDGGDSRESNYLSKNKSIKNLTDYVGRDEVFKTVEVVTEYRNERWITFAPKHGVVIRDIPNPYDHGQIPVVLLKYYPVDDDLYGLSEIEPVEKLQRAVNALWSQYVDSINMGLYTPLKVRSTGVQMHTLEFGPGKKWLMNDPTSDVVPHEQGSTGVAEFATTYRLLVGAMAEGLGEASAATSGLNPGSSDKTATEIKDTAGQRLSRDNFNQIFLSEALKKQMLFWHKMNQQFLFTPTEKVKVIRIVGKDAIRYFEQIGLGEMQVPDEVFELLASDDFADMNLNPMEFAMEGNPVTVGGDTLPKFAMDKTGDMGSLLVEPNDLSGTYDYIPDIESMSLPNEAELLNTLKQLVELSQNPAVQQSMMADGYRIRSKELMEDFFERAGLKDADKYFEKLPISQGGVDANGNPIPPGTAGAGGMPVNGGPQPTQSMAGRVPAPATVQNQAQLG